MYVCHVILRYFCVTRREREDSHYERGSSNNITFRTDGLVYKVELIFTPFTGKS